VPQERTAFAPVSSIQLEWQMNVGCFSLSAPASHPPLCLPIPSDWVLFSFLFQSFPSYHGDFKGVAGFRLVSHNFTGELQCAADPSSNASDVPKCPWLQLFVHICIMCVCTVFSILRPLTLTAVDQNENFAECGVANKKKMAAHWGWSDVSHCMHQGG
jgi:hypothetical protein